MHAWWSIAKSVPYLSYKIASIFSILMGSQPKFMMCNFQSKICKLCNSRSKDDATHILFDCDGLRIFRAAAWIRVIQMMPHGMICEIQDMTSREKTIYLMSCLGGSHIPEWTNVYVQIVNYVHDIYQQRASMYKEIEDGIT